MKLIVNAAKDWAIGKGNELLFHFKQDMQNFRSHTLGNVVVMGRKTLDSFPGGKPLPKRTNIVLTRNPGFEREGVIVCRSTEDLKKELSKYDSDRIYIIGGESVYREFLPLCDTAIVTKTEAVREGADTWMVNLDEAPDWEIAEESEPMEEKGCVFRFVTYKRV